MNNNMIDPFDDENEEDELISHFVHFDFDNEEYYDEEFDDFDTFTSEIGED